MASSYPPSYYHWYYRGDLVGNDSTLETGPLSLNMSGEYKCVATNNITGKNSTSITTLRVIGKRTPSDPQCHASPVSIVVVQHHCTMTTL